MTPYPQYMNLFLFCKQLWLERASPLLTLTKNTDATTYDDEDDETNASRIKRFEKIAGVDGGILCGKALDDQLRGESTLPRGSVYMGVVDKGKERIYGILCEEFADLCEPEDTAITNLRSAFRIASEVIKEGSDVLFIHAQCEWIASGTVNGYDEGGVSLLLNRLRVPRWQVQGIPGQYR